MATPFSPLHIFPIPNPKSSQLILSKFSSPPILTFPSTKSPTRKPHLPNFPNSINPKPITTIRRLFSSSNPEFLLSEATSVDNSQQIVPPSDDFSSTVISGLLFAAFIGLSILTVGVIYIAVTDFLQKRERDKFEKEEAAASAAEKKKRGKKGLAASRARGGPRGFGQKLDEEDDDVDGTD